MLLQPLDLVLKRQLQLIQTPPPVVPRCVVAIALEYDLLCQLKCSLADLIFFEDGSKVAHYFDVLLWVGDGCYWGNATLILLYRVDVIPLVPFDEGDKLTL